jgi:hypothetical protein
MNFTLRTIILHVLSKNTLLYRSLLVVLSEVMVFGTVISQCWEISSNIFSCGFVDIIFFSKNCNIFNGQVFSAVWFVGSSIGLGIFAILFWKIILSKKLDCMDCIIILCYRSSMPSIAGLVDNHNIIVKIDRNHLNFFNPICTPNNVRKFTKFAKTNCIFSKNLA